MTRNSAKSVQYGIVGGIVGGILFGIFMQIQGMLVMLAGTIGSDQLVVGWIIHMVISIIFGAGYGLLTRFVRNGWLLVLGYGVLIWVIGPLITMPLLMGMGVNLVNAFAPAQLMSLATHLFFSGAVAVTFYVLTRKQTVKTEAVA